MKIYIYIIGLLGLFLTACSGDNDPVGESANNENIVLSFQVNSFVKGTIKAATDNGSIAEQTIENLYVFLFPTSGTQTFKSYYISSASFSGGSWSNTDNKVLLNLTQAEAGNRDVYIVANCSDIKATLDGVTTVAGLQLVLQSSNTPWSETLATPILMSGNKSHNFNSNYQLSSIPLVRAVAKVQLNVKLSVPHQGTPLSSEDNNAQYRYKLINFDKNTYVLKPTSKPDVLVSSSAWVNWNDAVTSYTLDGSGNVIILTLTTYLNERDNAGTAIELSLPYFDGGLLPPPEFGEETYKLQLPAKIERNNWYVYDVEI
ncbi:fimbrial protein [Dysgonomonas sp.]